MDTNPFAPPNYYGPSSPSLFWSFALGLLQVAAITLAFWFRHTFFAWDYAACFSFWLVVQYSKKWNGRIGPVVLFATIAIGVTALVSIALIAAF